MSEAGADGVKLAMEALIILVRDEWPSGLSLEEIALRGRCTDEQVEAIRCLEAGELPVGVVEEPL